MMNTFLVCILLFLNIVYNTQACSLPKCPPGTQQCAVGRGGADCSGILGCHKTCPAGSNHIGPLVPTQCNGKQVHSPWDVCNTCGCEDGLVVNTCTEKSCSRGQKLEGELCGSDLNNCVGGLSCVWDGQKNNVGICKSDRGSQAKIKISGSDGYNIPKVTITFSNGQESEVIINEVNDNVPAEEGGLCFFNGVVANQVGSSVKLIGCLPEKDRHWSDQMTIILKAGIDSGWYTLYYATEEDTTITVKKARKKPNVEVVWKPTPRPTLNTTPTPKRPVFIESTSRRPDSSTTHIPKQQLFRQATPTTPKGPVFIESTSRRPDSITTHIPKQQLFIQATPTHLTADFLEKFPPPPPPPEEDEEDDEDNVAFSQQLVDFSY